MKPQYFQVLLSFTEIEWSLVTQFQARNTDFVMFLK